MRINPPECPFELLHINAGRLTGAAFHGGLHSCLTAFRCATEMQAVGLGACAVDDLFVAVMGERRVAGWAAPAVEGGVSRGHANSGCFASLPDTAGDIRAYRDPVPKSNVEGRKVALAGGHAGLRKHRGLYIPYY